MWENDNMIQKHDSRLILVSLITPSALIIYTYRKQFASASLVVLL